MNRGIRRGCLTGDDLENGLKKKKTQNNYKWVHKA